MLILKVAIRMINIKNNTHANKWKLEIGNRNTMTNTRINTNSITDTVIHLQGRPIIILTIIINKNV